LNGSRIASFQQHVQTLDAIITGCAENASRFGKKWHKRQSDACYDLHNP
jgi:hypothetical protein